MAALASEQALAHAHLDPTAIDVVIFAAASDDITEPATANVVQEKLGCRNAAVFDVKNACNSFLNALDIAQAFIQTGRAQRILVATGEVLSPSINWHIDDAKDLYLKFAGLTLGDGGGACVVVASDEVGRGVLPGRFVSDGSQWRLSTMLSCGTLMRHDTSKMYFESESKKMQTLAIEAIPPLLRQVTKELGWDMARDVALVIPHQVSRRVIELISKKTGYPLERCVITLDRVGNTAAASMPIALSMVLAEGRIPRGDKLLLVGGAAGFSAGVVPIIW
jgi:3-oxoacyl-[acyl-carrier-protein] synthase-3